jgi:hypothetical protein
LKYHRCGNDLITTYVDVNTKYILHIYDVSQFVKLIRYMRKSAMQCSIYNVQAEYFSGGYWRIVLRHLAILFFFVFLAGCENTDFKTVADAGSDAVKALTLSDADLQKVASQSAEYSDKKNTLATPENKHLKRLHQLV